jgi:hypothetical protein
VLGNRVNGKFDWRDSSELKKIRPAEEIRWLDKRISAREINVKDGEL